MILGCSKDDYEERHDAGKLATLVRQEVLGRDLARTD